MMHDNVSRFILIQFPWHTFVVLTFVLNSSSKNIFGTKELILLPCFFGKTLVYRKTYLGKATVCYLDYIFTIKCGSYQHLLWFYLLNVYAIPSFLISQSFEVFVFMKKYEKVMTFMNRHFCIYLSFWNLVIAKQLRWYNIFRHQVVNYFYI